LPHLRQDWLIPTVSFWRDFHPDRQLHHSRQLVAQLINRLAKAELVDEKKLDGATRDQELERISRWATEHASQSENDLLLGALESALSGGKRWFDIERQAQLLVERKDQRAMPLLRKFLVAPTTLPINRKAILQLCRELDGTTVRDLGVGYLADPELSTRVEAALILGARHEGARKVMGGALAAPDQLFGDQAPNMIKALFAEGSPASLTVAKQVFSNLDRMDGHVRAAVVQLFIEAGLPDGLRYYLDKLDVQGHRLGDTTYGAPVAQVFADEIRQDLTLPDPSLQALAKLPTGPASVSAAKKWLQQQLLKPPR
jgi:hypothetical protein